ncbi:MAG: metal ABC transporter permease [Clostridia bacterium]|nr:metal ABC transporter permease [Clostridia bacterium]
MYLEFPFVRHALIVGVLVSLCASLLGVTLVLKRFSFIGDGLSHVAFGAMSVAAVVGLSNEMTLVLPVTVAAAILLLCGGQRAKIKGDAAVAMISVSALAVGYMLMSIFPSSGNVSGDVCTTLFGSTLILTLSKTEVWLCVVLSLAVVTAFVLMYNKIFSITFDEDFARATGLGVGVYNVILATVIAVVIVLAMNLVGSLLISALVVFPALSAMRVCRSFKRVTVLSAVIAVGCSLVGLVVSILAGTPVGSTIVVADIAVFLIFTVVGAVRRK